MVTKAPELIEVNIDVDAASNYDVTVKTKPSVSRLVSGKHAVQFTANDPTTVIVYTETSPFSEAVLPVGKYLPIGPDGEGPFEVVHQGAQNPFACGYFDNGGKFVSWGKGGNTPT